MQFLENPVVEPEATEEDLQPASNDEVAEALANMGQDASVEGLLAEEPMTAEEAAAAAATDKGVKQLLAMDAVSSIGKPSSPDEAILIANTLTAALGSVPGEGEVASGGIELVEKGTQVLQTVGESVLDMIIVDPGMKEEIFGQLAEAMSNMLNILALTTSLPSDYAEVKAAAAAGKDPSPDFDDELYDYPDESGAETDAGGDNGNQVNMCAGIDPINLLSASKPGVFEQDTAITGSKNHAPYILQYLHSFSSFAVNMENPENPQNAMCGGTVDASVAQAARTEGVIAQLGKEMALSMLDSTALGQTHVIERGDVTVMSARTKDYGQWFVAGRDPVRDPKWRFTDPNFCVEDLKADGSCDAIMGVAAVAYSPPAFPHCSNVPTCDRLAKDTKVRNEKTITPSLKCGPSDRGHLRDQHGEPLGGDQQGQVRQRYGEHRGGYPAH